MGLCAWVVVLFVCLFVFGLLGLGLAVFGEKKKKKNPERKKNPPAQNLCSWLHAHCSQGKLTLFQKMH
jgi:hypothetical protein